MAEISPEAKSKNWKRFVKIFALGLISIFLVWFLISKITLDDLKTVLSEIDPTYILIGFVIYIIAYIFRSFRFYYLLSKKVRIKDIFTIVCVHNIINNILPARTGELSYIYLLKRHKIPLEERIASLLMARMFDFIMIACFFLISVLLLTKLPYIIAGAFWIIAISLIFLVLLLMMLLYSGDSFKSTINKIAVKLKISNFKITKRILKLIEDTLSSFNSIGSRQIIIKSTVLSIFIWTTLYLAYYLFTKAFQVELEFFEIIVIASFLALLPLLPFYSVGGFGTTEVTMTILFVAFGIPEAVAIVVSFGLHIIGLIITIILGILGFVLLGLKKGSGKDQDRK
jgi:uncharacterized protein (TIRG00374 family)